MAADEVSTSSGDATPPRGDRVDLRQVARVQRWLLQLIAVAILAYVFGFYAIANAAVIRGTAVVPVATSAFIILLVCYLMTIVFVILASVALQMRSAAILFLGLFATLPYLNMIALLYVNSRVTSLLKRAGIRVGFMGARRDDVERAVNSSLCSKCGYNLFGNVSGRCPECGLEIPTRAEATV